MNRVGKQNESLKVNTQMAITCESLDAFELILHLENTGKIFYNFHNKSYTRVFVS